MSVTTTVIEEQEEEQQQPQTIVVTPPEPETNLAETLELGKLSERMSLILEKLETMERLLLESQIAQEEEPEPAPALEEEVLEEPITIVNPEPVMESIEEEQLEQGRKKVRLNVW
jgi:hypothetical protein